MQGAVCTAAAVALVLVWARYRGAQWREPGFASGRRSPLGPTRHPGGHFLLAVAFLVSVATSLGLVGAIAVATGFGGHYPSLPPDMRNVEFLTGLLKAVEAGISEEIILVAVLVWLLEQHRVGPFTLYLTAISARLAFHVYYGPAVAGLLVWAVASVWLYGAFVRSGPSSSRTSSSTPKPLS